MIGEIRTLLRFALRSGVIPALLGLCALLAILNVAGAAQSVRADYAQLQHTRAEYHLNHMDFEADLKKPVTVTTHGDDQGVSNLARYDFDALSLAVSELAPASSVSETLKYFGFLLFPALFFLLGLWLAAGQRRYRLEKVALVRAGPGRTILARQLALLVIAAITVAGTLLVDVVARSIAQADVAKAVPLAAFTGDAAVQRPGIQWAVILLVTVFFGTGGIAIGTLSGVFAIPAIVFLAWDFVVPILGTGDPRNWFEVLGHSVFRYSTQFQLAEPIPQPIAVATSAAIVGSILFVALGYAGVRMRNPRAT